MSYQNKPAPVYYSSTSAALNGNAASSKGMAAVLTAKLIRPAAAPAQGMQQSSTSAVAAKSSAAPSASNGTAVAPPPRSLIPSSAPSQSSHAAPAAGSTAAASSAAAAAPTLLLAKPSAAAASNHPQLRKRRPIGRGMDNLGNTCFMNSALQCLGNCPSFYDWLVEHPSLCNLHALKSGGGCIVCVLSRLMIHQFAVVEGKDTSLLVLANNLPFVAPRFTKGRQEDSHEYLIQLLDTMEAMCQRRLKTAKAAPPQPGITPLPPVCTLFRGQFVSRVTCRRDGKGCGFVSETSDPFETVSLEISGLRHVSDAISRFTAKEFLDGSNAYKCEKCKAAVRAEKRILLRVPPQILCLHLKRFEFRGFYSVKDSHFVEFDRIVNLGTCMSLSPAQCDAAEALQNSPAWEGRPLLFKRGDRNHAPELNLQYRISSVNVHSGYSPQSGHYYTYARALAAGESAMESRVAIASRYYNNFNSYGPSYGGPPSMHSIDVKPTSWFELNDEHVDLVSGGWDAVRRVEAYMLFYIPESPEVGMMISTLSEAGRATAAAVTAPASSAARLLSSAATSSSSSSSSSFAPPLPPSPSAGGCAAVAAVTPAPRLSLGSAAAAPALSHLHSHTTAGSSGGSILGGAASMAPLHGVNGSSSSSGTTSSAAGGPIGCAPHVGSGSSGGSVTRAPPAHGLSSSSGSGGGADWSATTSHGGRDLFDALSAGAGVTSVTQGAAAPSVGSSSALQPRASSSSSAASASADHSVDSSGGGGDYSRSSQRSVLLNASATRMLTSSQSPAGMQIPRNSPSTGLEMARKAVAAKIAKAAIAATLPSLASSSASSSVAAAPFPMTIPAPHTSSTAVPAAAGAAAAPSSEWHVVQAGGAVDGDVDGDEWVDCAPSSPPRPSVAPLSTLGALIRASELERSRVASATPVAAVVAARGAVAAPPALSSQRETSTPAVPPPIPAGTAAAAVLVPEYDLDALESILRPTVQPTAAGPTQKLSAPGVSMYAQTLSTPAADLVASSSYIDTGESSPFVFAQPQQQQQHTSTVPSPPPIKASTASSTTTSSSSHKQLVSPADFFGSTAKSSPQQQRKHSAAVSVSAAVAPAPPVAAAAQAAPAVTVGIKRARPAESDGLTSHIGTLAPSLRVAGRDAGISEPSCAPAAPIVHAIAAPGSGANRAAVDDDFLSFSSTPPDAADLTSSERVGAAAVPLRLSGLSGVITLLRSASSGRGSSGGSGGDLTSSSSSTSHAAIASSGSTTITASAAAAAHFCTDRLIIPAPSSTTREVGLVDYDDDDYVPVDKHGNPV